MSECGPEALSWLLATCSSCDVCHVNRLRGREVFLFHNWGNEKPCQGVLEESPEIQENGSSCLLPYIICMDQNKEAKVGLGYSLK